MSNVLDTAKELKEELLSLESVKEYLKIKNLVETSEELKELRKEISKLEQENKLDEKTNLEKKYHSHPLVINFEILEEEIKNMLKSISNIIN